MRLLRFNATNVVKFKSLNNLVRTAQSSLLVISVTYAICSTMILSRRIITTVISADSVELAVRRNLFIVKTANLVSRSRPNGNINVLLLIWKTMRFVVFAWIL